MLDLPDHASLLGLADLRPKLPVERTMPPVEDAVARGLATLKAYAFASVDYPGAAWSFVGDTNGTTTVGYFMLDPTGEFCATAFTFAGGVYRTIAVPNATSSFAMGINASGSIVGTYEDAAGKKHGYTKTGATFANINVPNGVETQAVGINDAGKVVGGYVDASGHMHGFLFSGGTYTTIDFPGAGSTFASGINTGGDIVGAYTDAGGNPHSFVRRAGAFTRVEFPLAA
jgi:probable HAF family extracellular repeat protein